MAELPAAADSPALRQLCHPPVAQLDPQDGEYLAFELDLLVIGLNRRANELFATYNGAVAQVIVEYRDLVKILRVRAEAYRRGDSS